MEIADKLKNYSVFSSDLLWQIVDCVYPPTCIGCGRIGYEICPGCISKIETIELNQICDFCGINLVNSGKKHHCRKKKDFALSELKTYSYYTGLMREIIRDFKFNKRIGVLRDLIPSITVFFLHWKPDINLIIPVALNTKRKKQRGYNQSAILGKRIAKELGVGYSERALQRTRDTQTQVGLNYLQRQANVKDAFKAEKRIVHEKTILLVDDISTTGSTINECAKALLLSGAKNVCGFTLARPKNNFMKQ